MVHAEDSLCAIVKIEIPQTLTLERQAFDARLAITNHLDTIPLEDVKINIIFTDEEGNSIFASTDPNNTQATFFIRVDSMEGVTGVTGEGIIQPKVTGEIHWLIIPAPGAGGDIPSGKRYDVGAILTFTQNGEPQEIIVAPDLVFVKPLPNLTLDYFLTQDVHADDALTPEIEPSEPFTLGVRVKNTGGGPANRLSIDTAQPRIVENGQGLLIDFRITGAQVDDEPVTPSLLVDFGNLPPNGARIARWQMETALSGQFLDFGATFSHADELGGALTSVIESATTHLLIKDVWVNLPGRDGVRDFLARDGDVLRIYESDGEDTKVLDLSSEARLHIATGGRYTLTLPTTPGFGYASMTDPFSGRKIIVDALRADGKRLPLDNIWFARHRVEGGPWNHTLNLFDVAASHRYTVVFDDPPQRERPPTLQFIPDRWSPIGRQISFLVEAGDPDGDWSVVTAEPIPPGASFIHQPGNNKAVATYVFDWTPQAGQQGRYEIAYTASDGAAEVVRTAAITIMTDSDGDGLDDEWELTHFGTLTYDASDDNDGDGMANLAEYRNGTDPADRGGTGLTMLAALPDAVLGMPYDGGFHVNNGAAPYTFALLDRDAELPPGLELTVDGRLIGTPVRLGLFAFTVGVRDGAGATATRRVSLTVVKGDIYTIGESGSLSLDHEPKTVFFDRAYTHPVVLVSPPTYNGRHSAVIRLAEVEPDRFTLHLQEAPNHDGVHGNPELIDWMVLEAGVWQLADGTRLEVGMVETEATIGRLVTDGRWQSLDFTSEFLAPPVLISQVQTANHPGYVSTRHDRIETSGASIALEGAESRNELHGRETIGWVAIEPGAGDWNGWPFEAGTTDARFTHRWERLSFTQSFNAPPRLMANLASYNDADNATLRRKAKSKGGASEKLRVLEDSAEDRETRHDTAEAVSYFALAAGADDQPLHAEDSTGLFQARPQAAFEVSRVSDQEFELDARSAWDEDGSIVDFRWDFGDGSGAEGARVSHRYTRAGLYNVTLTVTDDQGLSGGIIRSVAIGDGEVRPMGESGWVDGLTDKAHTVRLSRGYADPIVFAQPLPENGADAAVIRVMNVRGESFSLQVQKPENLDDSPVNPTTVSWLVLEAGEWLLDNGGRLSVGRFDTDATVGRKVSHRRWESVRFNPPYDEAPVVISQVQTSNHPRFVKTRQRNAESAGVELALEADEGQTTLHGDERIGWLAIEPGRGLWGGRPFEAGRTAAAVTEKPYPIVFAQPFAVAPVLAAVLSSYNGRDSASLRLQPGSLTAAGATLSIDEDTALDSESRHPNAETVDYLIMPGGGILQAEPLDVD